MRPLLAEAVSKVFSNFESGRNLARFAYLRRCVSLINHAKQPKWGKFSRRAPFFDF